MNSSEYFNEKNNIKSRMNTIYDVYFERKRKTTSQSCYTGNMKEIRIRKKCSLIYFEKTDEQCKQLIDVVFVK